MAGKNICNCPQPPGGTVECDSNQVALCYIENGQKRSICRTPPSSQIPLVVVSWLYELVTGRPTSVSHLLSSSDIQMLLSGETTRKGVGTVTFSVPAFIRDILKEMDDGQDSGEGGINSPVRPTGPRSTAGKRQKREETIRKAATKKAATKHAAKKMFR